MKSNLAHESPELQQSKQCHLCGVVDDYTSYFQTKYEQLICFGCDIVTGKQIGRAHV